MLKKYYKFPWQNPGLLLICLSEYKLDQGLSVMLELKIQIFSTILSLTLFGCLEMWPYYYQVIAAT